MRAAGATAAAVYLVEPGEAQRTDLTASVGGARFTQSYRRGAALSRHGCGRRRRPCLSRPNFSRPSHCRLCRQRSASPYRWRGTLLGFIVLGPQRTGADYTAEDFDFLRTVAEQAATSIMAVPSRGREAGSHRAESERSD